MRYSYTIEINRDFRNGQADSAEIKGEIYAANLVDANYTLIDYIKNKYNVSDSDITYIDIFDNNEDVEENVKISEIRYFKDDIAVTNIF